MVNGSDSLGSAHSQPESPSEATSLVPGPNSISTSPPSESEKIEQTGSDGDRIHLPASQETVPAYVRKQSEFLGLRRGLDGLQVLLVLVLAFFSASFAIRNSDFFLHLATGRALSQGTYQFGVDPFSYTTEGVYWVNHSWLYDLGVYHVFNWAGGSGLVVIKAIMVALLAWIMLQTRRKDQGIWIPAMCTGLAILALSPRLLLNPAIVSYLFLAITLCLLTWRSAAEDLSLDSKTEEGKGKNGLYRCLALILLVGLWANLDAWFILGPITIGLFLLGEVIQGLLAPVEPGKASSQAKERQWLGLALVGSLAVCLANPHHVKVFEWPIELGFGVPAEVSKNPSFAGIFQSPWMRDYWKTPELGANVAGLAYYPLVFLGLLSFLANSRNFRWWRLLVWGAFLLVTAWRARTIPFFAVASGPILALNFQDFAVAVWPTLKERSSGIFGWLVWGRALGFLVLLALVVGAWPGLLQATPHENRHVNWIMESDKSLERAANELNRLRQEGLIQEGDRGFTLAPEFGYYCAWFCPDEKGFLDARISLFPASVWQEFFKLRSTIRPSSQLTEQPKDVNPSATKPNDEIKEEFFRKWHINHVVYLFDSNPKDSQAQLLEMGLDPKHWTLLAIKGRSAIFGWNDPQKPEANKRFAAHAYDANREAFGADASNNLLPKQPIPQTQRRDEWLEKAMDLAYAKPIRSVDGDEANLHLVHGLILNLLEAQRAQGQLLAAQAALGVGYAAGFPAPSCVITFAKWHLFLLKNLSMSGSAQQPILPAPLILAIRAARRAIADNPASAIAYLNLARAYLSLPEGLNWRDVNNPSYLVSSLRRVQAATALRAAITLDPDLADAHRMLYQYYMTEQFNYQAAFRGQRNRSAPFSDLALQHLTRAIEITRAQNRRENRDLLEDMETREKDLEQKVRTAKNEWLVQTNNPNMPLLEKAIQAGYKGLAGEALKTLESASVPELTSSDNLKNPVDMDLDGIRIQLDLELRCGKTMDVHEALYSNESSLTKNPRLKEMGQIPLPCYKWIAVQYAAAVGDFAQADSILEEMIEEARQRNRQDLTFYANLFLGANGDKQIDFSSFVATVLMQMPRPKPIGLVLLQRMFLISNLNTFRKASLVAREEADFSVLRAELALETGDTKSARRFFEHAHLMANPSTFYLKPMATFGETRALPLLAATAAISNVNPSSPFSYPLQDWTALYLNQFQANDKNK
jgi:hypothetical protein